MEARSRGTHPPLRRTSAKAPSPAHHSTAHPLLFATSSSDSSSDSLSSPPERGAEAADSCYSSCSEESLHASLSREASDSLARLSLSEEEATELDESLVEFATKLGYSEQQLRQVVQKIGSTVGQ
uniref:UBA_6 domain-containing protein n=1 Tax=Steinernema glaseri TaxID=37863 RepID=A0A1I7Z5L3_9BILA